MSTTAQIKANRQNAQKSTGPKTDEGKAAVSQNALKHGLFSESVVTSEDPAEYEAFHDNMLAELAPVGAVELLLAERVASLWWRLRRAERMQNQVIEDMIENKVTNPSAIRSRERHCYNDGLRPGDTKFEPEHLALGRIAISDWSCTRVIDRMLLYERRIESSLNRAMRELKRFQVMRRIEMEDAEKQQTTHSKAVPKRGTGFQPVENMAKMAMPPDKAPSLRDEDATRCASTHKDIDLKKQTQFAAANIDVKSYVKGDYDKMPAFGDEENKANRSQFHAAEPTGPAGKMEKPVTAAAGQPD